MTDQRQPTNESLVLHVIPTPLARGAQREARALADRLNLPGTRDHRVLSLFDGPPEVHADFSLHCDEGAGARSGYRPRVVPKLRSTLKRLAPALVIAHGGDPLKYLVPAMAGQRRPLAYYAIGTYAGRPGARLQRLIWRRLMAHVDVVVAEGPEVERECIERFRVPTQRVVMIPNGRDPAVFYPRGTQRATSPPELLFVGALNNGKRPDRFVEVVALLRARGLNVGARLIGGGPLHESLIEPAREADIELLGMRPDVADQLRRADILVFPSRPTGEGMPGVLIEAGLSGLPVVATDVPGVRSIIEDGETGLIVHDDTLDTLTEAVARLVENEPRRTAMGAAARRRCRDLFGLDSVATTWLEALDPLLARNGTS